MFKEFINFDKFNKKPLPLSNKEKYFLNFKYV